jgi:hypothetical protein
MLFAARHRGKKSLGIAGVHERDFGFKQKKKKTMCEKSAARRDGLFRFYWTIRARQTVRFGRVCVIEIPSGGTRSIAHILKVIISWGGGGEENVSIEPLLLLRDRKSSTTQYF